MRAWAVIAIVVASIWTGCQQDMPAFEDDTPYYQDLPAFAPDMPIPDDNQLTTQRVKLGEKLFFDKRLSRDLTVSCGTCHQPQNAFADNNERAIGIGEQVGLRNVPSLMNVGYGSKFNWDGGARSLEAQVLVPINSHKEMDMTLDKITERLNEDPEYAQLAREAYSTDFNNLVIIKALASFERTITSFNSPFDDYYYRGQEDAISAKAKRGFQLFMSEETHCSSCHAPPLFTNHAFQNIGLEKVYADSGLGRVSHNASDIGKFKVPSLRNVAVTGPYMHDGSIKKLEEVVSHFDEGGTPHPNKSKLIKPLQLSEQEQKELISFLKSLTDQSFELPTP